MENGEEKKENGKSIFFSFHFSKPLKFVLGLPKWEFSTGERHFTPGKKKKRKNDFAPSEKYFSYASGLGFLHPHQNIFFT